MCQYSGWLRHCFLYFEVCNNCFSVLGGLNGNNSFRCASVNGFGFQSVRGFSFLTVFDISGKIWMQDILIVVFICYHLQGYR